MVLLTTGTVTSKNISTQINPQKPPKLPKETRKIKTKHPKNP